MFILDVFKFCESYERFNRQHLAAFIYRHKECERMAKAAGVNTRYFASSASKEFLARCMTEGYIDGVNGSYWSKGSTKRPFEFSFRCLEGESDKYTNEMMTIKEMTDDQLFA
ncbi:YdbL [Escherichia phage e4/1c]|uniref:YdbL n=1 Tax=Escherichia phage e4/1c TaxID=1495286 RepID=A0A023ZUE9_9CAUD|nr:YdbL [Escherichia phage e4/1c]AHY83204.1 YdbL [Escherichia phage e4/1c]